jgi:hypothetical protein
MHILTVMVTLLQFMKIGIVFGRLSVDRLASLQFEAQLCLNSAIKLIPFDCDVTRIIVKFLAISEGCR